jgi:hypothetical protein
MARCESSVSIEDLLNKVRQLPPSLIQEVHDFVDFLHSRQEKHEQSENHIAATGQTLIDEEDGDADLASSST